MALVHFPTNDLLPALRDSGASDVIIHSVWPAEESLNFLGALAGQIRRLSVSGTSIADLSVVSELRNLEGLNIASSVEDVDFSRLVRLQECGLSEVASLGNIHECPSLEDLRLLSVRIRDVKALTPLKSSLRRLILSNMNSLTTLEGVEALKLEELRLIYLGRVRSIAPVTKLRRLRLLEVTGSQRIVNIAQIGKLTSLRELHIERGPALPSFAPLKPLSELRVLKIWDTRFASNRLSIAPLTHLRKLRKLHLAGGIRGVTDIERLGEMTSLEELRIQGGPQLPSLNFLRSLRKLRVLDIASTEIAEGNLEVLLKLPRLERIDGIHPHRRRYSHTVQELNAALRGPARDEAPDR